MCSDWNSMEMLGGEKVEIVEKGKSTEEWNPENHQEKPRSEAK